MPISSSEVIILAFAASWLTVVLGRIAYRLYLHPLRDIPGPRLAAATDLYGFYYNHVRKGMYSKRFSHLHGVYKSPVLRIAPNHVHVNEPAFYEVVFGSRSKFLKDPSFYRALDPSGGILSIIDPDEYRQYRSHLSSLFSPRVVSEILPFIMQELRKLSNALQARLATGTPVDIQTLFRSLSADILCQSMLGHSLDFIDHGDEGHPFLNTLDKEMANTWIAVHFPGLMKLIGSLPLSIQAMITPPEFEWFSKKCNTWLQMARERRSARAEKQEQKFFDIYLDMESSERRQFSIPDPLVEGGNLLGAGIDTTSYTLASMVFYLLRSPECLRTLRAELDQHKDLVERAELKPLQQLPYLFHGEEREWVHAFFRKGYVKPPLWNFLITANVNREQTVVSISHPVIQMNDNIFPQPEQFKPDRWLGGENMERWNLAFSKGPRRCIGMNLAYAILYSVSAYIFGRFEMKLFRTDDESIMWDDYFVPRNRSHVRVIITRDRWEEEEVIY
ncbi:hypothetical protein CDV55_105553 [Aspergillus turcosus]|nr:hypothetical protein CDV55_105553 [Aspergillus turcosus]